MAKQGYSRREYHLVEQQRNWADIPIDILSVIFHKLGVAEVLLSAQAVCRSWRQMALNPVCQVWRCIDTRYLRQQRNIFLRFPKLHEVKLNQLAIKRSGGHLEKLYLCSGYSGEFLTYIAGRTERLRCLTLITGKPHRQELAYFLAHCPLLEELHMCSPPFRSRYEFEDMQLDGQYQLLDTETDSGFDYSCYVMDKHFGVTQDRYQSKLGFDTDEEMSNSEDIFWRPPYSDMISYCDGIAMQIATNMPQLRELQLVRLRITNEGLHAVLDKCLRLESLDIRSCFDLCVDDDLQAKLAKIKNVKVSPQSLDSFDSEAGEDEVLMSVDE